VLKKLLFLILLLVLPASADIKTEINYLLNYVKTTKCTYIRNGTKHNGIEAEKHIQAKYDHYKKEITTTEDFIKLSATKSLISGNKYYIECPGSPKIESGKWLLAELKRFRAK
jgi:hypothetical protein